MGDGRGETGAAGERDRLQGLRQGADLVDLDENGVRRAFRDAAGETRGAGDEEIVADQKDALPERGRERRPAGPVVFREAVLDRGDRITAGELLEPRDHPAGVAHPALALQPVGALSPERAGGHVQRQQDVLSGPVARRFDGLHDVPQRLLGAFERGREAALVADTGREPCLREAASQAVENLGAHAHRLGHAPGGDRHDHELLHVDGVVGMGAAVQDVHQGDGQRARVEAADIAEQGLADLGRRGPGGGEAHAQDRVRTEAALVVGAVEGDERGIEAGLLGGFHAAQRRKNLLVHRPHRLAHTQAAEPPPAIAPLDRFMAAGGGAGGDGGAPLDTGLQRDVDFHRRVAAAVEDLPRPNIRYRTHGLPFPPKPAPLIGKLPHGEQGRGHARPAVMHEGRKKNHEGLEVCAP